MKVSAAAQFKHESLEAEDGQRAENPNHPQPNAEIFTPEAEPEHQNRKKKNVKKEKIRLNPKRATEKLKTVQKAECKQLFPEDAEPNAEKQLKVSRVPSSSRLRPFQEAAPQTSFQLPVLCLKFLFVLCQTSALNLICSPGFMQEPFKLKNQLFE